MKVNTTLFILFLIFLAFAISMLVAMIVTQIITFKPEELEELEVKLLIGIAFLISIVGAVILFSFGKIIKIIQMRINAPKNEG